MEQQQTYEKPEIKDFGSLQEITAACTPSGSGDYLAHALEGADSHGHHCTSN